MAEYQLVPTFAVLCALAFWIAALFNRAQIKALQSTIASKDAIIELLESQLRRRNNG